MWNIEFKICLLRTYEFNCAVLIARTMPGGKTDIIFYNDRFSNIDSITCFCQAQKWLKPSSIYLDSNCSTTGLLRSQSLLNNHHCVIVLNYQMHPNA